MGATTLPSVAIALLLPACGDAASGGTMTESDASSGATSGVDGTASQASTGPTSSTTSMPGTASTNAESSESGTESSTGGPAPMCDDDDDCPPNTTCDVEAGTCVCDPTAATCLAELPAGHWMAIEGSAMSQVFPPPKTVPGNPGAIVEAWSGGVYDRERRRMVVWGGGHADYSGNEVYTFDLASLTWTREDDPSLDVGGDEASGYYPDGRPRSRHTYDYLAYAPGVGMCSMGGAGLWMSGQIGVANVDCYDFDTLTWSARASAPEGTIAGIADYDEITGRIAYVLGPQLRYLAQYDVAADSWTAHGDNFTNGGLGHALTGRVHPTARVFVAVGGGAIYSWDLDEPGAVVEVALSLADAPPGIDRNNPGLDYDAAIDRLVWWGGGTSVWSLDLDGNTWIEHPAAPDNATTPPEPVDQGTYGRFRHAIDDDVFVLVNYVDDNVYVRRL